MEATNEEEKFFKKIQNKIKREIRRSALINILNDVRKAGCSKCHTSEHLTFHHLDPSAKIWNVSTMVARNCTIKQLRAELAKCVLLCRECHDEEHAK